MTCAGCGCVCDDVGADWARACPLGEAWRAERSGERPPVARVDGVAVELDEALDAAAAVLGAARAPLVYGLGQTSIEAQRHAVAIAEATGAVIDPAGAADVHAFAALGASTATFGEIRDRAELVVVWRADPAVTNPRLLERIRPRALVVADTQRTATAEQADAFVELDEGFEALWALRALLAGAPLARSPALDPLPERLKSAGHVALVHGPLDELSALAMTALVVDLSRERHAVSLALRADGNARGAEDVITWQTGFPSAVSFARGAPRANPGEFSAAALLERGEVDAALVVAAEALPGMRALPLVAIDTHATPTLGAARVAIAAAPDGLEVAGTVHRMDGVPIGLEPLNEADRPGVEGVLAALAGRL